YGHALALFAASADALIELQIIANHGYVLERLRSVADQRGVAHRRGDFAVFDQVSLRGREDELAVGDVDLPATEVHGVQTALDAAQNILRIVFAGQHVGVGHAWHRDCLIALAPTRTSVGHAHQS